MRKHKTNHKDPQKFSAKVSGFLVALFQLLPFKTNTLQIFLAMNSKKHPEISFQVSKYIEDNATNIVLQRELLHISYKDM